MEKLFICVLVACLSLSTSARAQRDDGIFYSSLNHAIQLGQFDGVATLKELKKHGDFGLGSQHGLAGELVLLNGHAYKISVDGKAVNMSDSTTLPFAAAKFFKAERKLIMERPLSMEELQLYLDSVLNTNMFAAIKVTGSFKNITYKCYYPQQKPYPPITNTPAKFFDSTDNSGTMVGFFTPKSAKALNSPNYHFHFINKSHTSGGHADKCIVERVTIEIDYADALTVILPSAAQLTNIDLNK